MINRLPKHLLIAGLNGIALTFLLALWTDRVELIYNLYVRPIEFLKIIGITVLSLIGMYIIRKIIKGTNEESKLLRIKYSVLFTLLISAYFYVTYSVKVIERFRNNARVDLGNKVELRTSYPYGSHAIGLTRKEYSIITNLNWFPEISEFAENISYWYVYDGFLPDYTFTLEYQVPHQVLIEEIELEEDQFHRHQSFKFIDGIKIVEYSEGLM